MEKRSINALVRAVKSGKYERVRQKKWDDEHICTASCRIRKEAYKQFQKVCEYHETSVHRALRAYIAHILVMWYRRENVSSDVRYADALYHTMTEQLPL